MKNSFKTLDTIKVKQKSIQFYSLAKLAEQYAITNLPFTHKILLENLLRLEDGENITRQDIAAVATWDALAEPETEISFTPSRVLLQDFTGVPVVVDLAALRDALGDLGGDPAAINPGVPVELVIDHSVQVDKFGTSDALDLNAKIEFQRNKERYEFLKWGQNSFKNFSVVPPATGIVHQVNLEYLARVVFTKRNEDTVLAYPDTLVGTDSHTTMINGLGILGWGVGGIEAEAAMLGQPIPMLIPKVVGFELVGKMVEGTTATDLVLTVVEMLRGHGVVGKFVEFYGDGLDHLPLADRATIANMAPEYGATCGFFPIDNETLNYLRLSGREEEHIDIVETYAKAQGMFRVPGQKSAKYSSTLSLDMSRVEPCIAGPKRPQDRILLSQARQAFLDTKQEMLKEDNSDKGAVKVVYDEESFELKHGAVVLAAITSCTNTSNPAVMLGAGLLARNALAKGLKVKPWVKTSLAPGSKVVTDYLQSSNLLPDLEALGFYVVGYGCTTCIGNSGPLPQPISDAITQNDLIVASVLSGNRNFEGRIHQNIRTNYLASPPLVVAYALAGRMDIDLSTEPLGIDQNGDAVHLADLWPSNAEIQEFIMTNVNDDKFEKNYAVVYSGNEQWNDIRVPEGDFFQWQTDSTYIKKPTFFDGIKIQPDDIKNIEGARCIAKLGDSITTDHISPAGSIDPDSPAGEYLQSQGVLKADFNSYGSRRGNHEVMVRGTFANIRLRNHLSPNKEGGWTCYFPTGAILPLYDAAMKYQQDGTPLIVLAGKEYGAGSSRDWAAKGTMLLGVRTVIAQSFERIHRSNLIGMGVLPLMFNDGESAETLDLDGEEIFTFEGLDKLQTETVEVLNVIALGKDGKQTEFTLRVRLDTPKEREYYRHGGILQYALRKAL